MKKYAIIQVWQCYDDIEGVECVDSFDTKKECNKIIKSMTDKRDAEWKKRFDYIEKYVDDFEIPKIHYTNWNYDNWKKYLLQIHWCLANGSVDTKNFKDQLKMYIRGGTCMNLKDFNSPDYSEMGQLFVVKLK
jgi:hypothetical protein